LNVYINSYFATANNEKDTVKINADIGRFLSI